MALPSIEYGAHNPEDNRLGAILRTPYDADFVAELKETISPRQRAWTGEFWWVSESVRSYAQDLMLHHWPEIQVINDEGQDYIVDRHGTITVQEQADLF